MNLFKETSSFLAWFRQVMRTFLHVRPATTTSVVLMTVASRVSYVLATFIPLKVVLLAGYSGVPRYFRFFIDPEHKSVWIVVLASGAIAFYILSVVLNNLTERFSQTGSEQVLRRANVAPSSSNQQALAQNYYSRFCRISADTIFVAAWTLIGLLINFRVFLFVIGIMLVLFCVSAYMVRTLDEIEPAPAAVYIRYNLNNYVKILSSFVFLSSFVVLLIFFLFSDYSNVLAAILSIIVIRQTQSAITSTVRDSVRLASEKDKVNALVFRDKQLTQKEISGDRSYRFLFDRKARKELVERELSRIADLAGTPRVEWVDPLVPGVTCFDVSFKEEPSGEERHLRKYVFPPRQLQKLEHESFLFDHIQRDRLKAPKVVAQFLTGPFKCRLCEAGTGRPVPVSDWDNVRMELLKTAWSCRPPSALVNAYRASAPPLENSMNGDLMSSLQLAADTEEDRESLEDYVQYLDVIKARLKSVPLHIRNPDITPENVLISKENDFLVMTWTRWTLEPVGVGMPPGLKDGDLVEIMNRVRQTRKDVPESLVPNDFLFAALCREVDKHSRNKRYRQALFHLKWIVEYLKNGSKNS